jgi:NADH dehydrogenase (ubiquinone) 1 beta subcomplex subunit 10
MAEPFHREYPRVPTYDEIDKRDAVAVALAREQWVRDRAIELEKVKILRQRVSDCSRKEGVNHMQNCRKEVKEYMTALREYRSKGEQRN